DGAGEAHLVRHADHGHARFRQFDHHVEHFFDHLRIERRRRLVEQHHLGIHAERACDRDTLLLPARELTRILARLPGNSHPLEVLHRRGLRLIARLTAHPDGTKRAVLQDREMWEKIEVLKDHPDFTAHQLNVPDVVGELDAIDDYSSALMLLQAVYAADQGRLARAGRSADDDPLAAIDTEVDLLQHVKLPIPFMDADHLDDR